MPPYEYLLCDRAFYALEACEDAAARQLLLAIEMLATILRAKRNTTAGTTKAE